MSLQRKKFTPAYNRAKEKLKVGLTKYDPLKDSNDPFDWCHSEHEYHCNFCGGPFMNEIRKGYLGNLLLKLKIHSAKNLADYF